MNNPDIRTALIASYIAILYILNFVYDLHIALQLHYYATYLEVINCSIDIVV